MDVLISAYAMRSELVDEDMDLDEDVPAFSRAQVAILQEGQRRLEERRPSSWCVLR